MYLAGSSFTIPTINPVFYFRFDIALLYSFLKQFFLIIKALWFRACIWYSILILMEIFLWLGTSNRKVGIPLGSRIISTLHSLNLFINFYEI